MARAEIGTKGFCEYCQRETLRQCRLCDRWMCDRDKGKCPCLLSYVTVGRDEYRMVHTFRPDADAQAGIHGVAFRDLFNIRIDTAPEKGAIRCPECFADAPELARPDGWGHDQAVIAVSIGVAGLDQYRQGKNGRNHNPVTRPFKAPSPPVAPAVCIENETHEPTPEQVMWADAIVGLPVAERRIAGLLNSIAGAESVISTDGALAITLDDPKRRKLHEGAALDAIVRLAGLRAKLQEEQRAHTAFLTTILAGEPQA